MRTIQCSLCETTGEVILHRVSVMYEVKTLSGQTVWFGRLSDLPRGSYLRDGKTYKLLLSGGQGEHTIYAGSNNDDFKGIGPPPL